MKTSKRYIPEAGDAIWVPKEENDGKEGLGTIRELRQHCGNCPRYADVVIKNVIVWCPDLDQISWHPESNHWESVYDYE